MLVNSESVVNQYLIKYVNDPYQPHSEKELRVDRFYLFVDDEICSSFDEDEMNYVLILSHMSSQRRKLFLRFYSVYLYRIYSIKKRFHIGDINWRTVSEFVNSNPSYKQLLLSCLNVFI